MIKKIRNFIKNHRQFCEIAKNNKDDIQLLYKLIENLNVEEKLRLQKIEESINGIGDLIQKKQKEQCKVNDNIMEVINVLDYSFWREKMLTNKTLYDEELCNRRTSYRSDFNPLVSIIIPVYNGANYMKYAIDSALSQTYKNIEIIVVNDGSKDNYETEKIAKSYGSKIRYISKENGGVSSALNAGIRNMKGEYFAWLSHDDKYYPNHVEENINYLRYCNNYESIIPYSCFDIIDENGYIRLNDTVAVGNHVYDYKLTRNSHYGCILRGEVNGGNVLIPRKAFEECGFFEEGNRITQEKEMWSRLLKKYTFINIPIITYSIRSHSKQVTNTDNNIREETDKKIKEIVDSITEKEMIEESGTISNFYYDLYLHYDKNSIKELADEFYKRYEETMK